MNKEILERLYLNRAPINSRALDRVKSCLSGLIEDFSKDRLFRVSIVNDRIKSFKRLYEKTIETDIHDEKAVFNAILDIVGVRLVTNNLSDMRELHATIQSMKSLEYVKDSLEDYTENPQESGYRAIHFYVKCEVEYKGEQYIVPCEVQIQTLLQNSWATLTHQDIYKQQTDLPKHVKLLSRRLADQLAVLDDIAQDIRDAVSEAVMPLEISDDAPITKEGLSNIYFNQFNKYIQDYQIQVWMNALKSEEIQTLGQSKKLIPTPEVFEKMNTIYHSFWGDDVDMPEDTMLLYGTRIMSGAANAYQSFRSAVEMEYQDIMRIGKRETLSDLPDTIDELIESLRAGDIGISDIWSSLEGIGGLSECGRCGELYFDSDKSYEALTEHYEEENTELIDLLYQAEADGGFEVESANLSGYCSYCGHMMSKD